MLGRSFGFRRNGFVDALLRELDRSSVVLLVAPRGGGKTHLLHRLFHEREKSGTAVLAQLEPLACSPEVLASELHERLSPILVRSAPPSSFEDLLETLRRRRSDSLLLLDDVTELRTLSYYPTVTEPLPRFLDAVGPPGRCVLTSRFSYWMRRSFPELAVLGLPRLTSDELAEAGVADPLSVAAASGGIAMHACRLAETMERGLSVAEALVAELSPGGRIEAECRATLAELLHRARGYGACKSVLRVLAEEEDLKLSEVARRLDRTAGSTRDYLRWLEEVDLIAVREKRFSYVDPLLRVWMRSYGKGTLAEREDIECEVERYLSSRASSTPTKAEETIAVEETRSFTLPPLPTEDLVEID